MAKDYPKIYYTSCMGMLINYNDKNILIDGINSPNIAPYMTVKKETLINIVKKNEPFNKIDIILVTHEHREHFQPDLTCQILSACPEATLIAPKTVISLLRQSQYFKKRFITQLISIDLDLNKSIEFNLKNVKICAARLLHDDNAKFSSVKNIAYLMYLGDINILHVGDAEADIEQFDKSALSRKINCLIAPFKYLVTENGIATIASLNIKYLVAAHFPQKEYDNGKILQKAEQIKNSPNSPYPRFTYFLTENMSEISLR